LEIDGDEYIVNVFNNPNETESCNLISTDQIDDPQTLKHFYLTPVDSPEEPINTQEQSHVDSYVSFSSISTSTVASPRQPYTPNKIQPKAGMIEILYCWNIVFVMWRVA